MFISKQHQIFTLMSKIFAGIAVFPAGAEEYNVSISLVSSSKGSVISNKSTSSPIRIASLAETVQSMISSDFSGRRTIESYFTSVPPAFPADRYYDIFNALESAKLVDKHSYPALPLNHGEAYAARLQKPKTTTRLVVLDLTSIDQLYATNLFTTTDRHRKRVNTITHELSTPYKDAKTLQAALENVATLPKKHSKGPTQIVLIKPTGIAIDIDIDELVAGIYPNVPVSIATSNCIAQAAASFAYANSLLVQRHVLGRFCTIAPVSVATASGTAVLLSPSAQVLSVDFFITLTNSLDNQKSATIRLLIGNYRQAKDNLQRGVIVLDGLNPLPKGEARIRVSIKVLVFDGWREAAQIAVEQKNGPSKTFLFPRFFADLPRYYEEYNVSVKKEEDDDWLEDSDEVVGKLPE